MNKKYYKGLEEKVNLQEQLKQSNEKLIQQIPNIQQQIHKRNQLEEANEKLEYEVLFSQKDVQILTKELEKKQKEIDQFKKLDIFPIFKETDEKEKELQKLKIEKEVEKERENSLIKENNEKLQLQLQNTLNDLEAGRQKNELLQSQINEIEQFEKRREKEKQMQLENQNQDLKSQSEKINKLELELKNSLQSKQFIEKNLLESEKDLKKKLEEFEKQIKLNIENENDEDGDENAIKEDIYSKKEVEELQKDIDLMKELLEEKNLEIEKLNETALTVENQQIENLNEEQIHFVKETILVSKEQELQETLEQLVEKEEEVEYFSDKYSSIMARNRELTQKLKSLQSQKTKIKTEQEGVNQNSNQKKRSIMKNNNFLFRSFTKISKPSRVKRVKNKNEDLLDQKLNKENISPNKQVINPIRRIKN